MTKAAFGAVIKEMVLVVHQALVLPPEACRLAPLYDIGPRVLSIVSSQLTELDVYDELPPFPN